jgi:hypothetical protein
MTNPAPSKTSACEDFAIPASYTHEKLGLVRFGTSVPAIQQ